MLICGIIKIKYKFWSIQPVFHYYNILYWIYPPGVIQKNVPKINKYVDLINIKTDTVENYTETEIQKMIGLIQIYFLKKKDAQYQKLLKQLLTFQKKVLLLNMTQRKIL